MKKHLIAFACSMFLWTAGSPASAQTNYVLGPQDVLNITVLGEENLSRKYTIEQDGTFTFPLIGRVTARGLTLRALEQELRT
jgi:polysaccharide export outer membrane protein